MQPRHRNWSRSASTVVGIAVVPVAAAWAVIAIADSITAVAAQPTEQIVGTGVPAPFPPASIGAALSGSGLAASATNAWDTAALPVLVVLLVMAALVGAGLSIQRRRPLTAESRTA